MILFFTLSATHSVLSLIGCCILSTTTTSSSGKYAALVRSMSSSAFGDTSYIGREDVHIYPYGTKDLKGNVKVLHLIRHAEGHHNVNRQYRDIRNLDASLTPTGIEQCLQLSQRIQQAAASEASSPLADLAGKTDLIVTSPLTRCIQTTLMALDAVIQTRQPPIIAHESIRETVNYNCDRRRSVAELSREFASVDFSQIETDHDGLWDGYVRRLGCDETWTQHRESAELHVVADRGSQFFQWLQTRSETHVTVCTHSAFLRCILHYGLKSTIPWQPVQLRLDDDSDDNTQKRTPVVRYCGDDETVNHWLRSDYANCEIRSMIVHFPSE